MVATTRRAAAPDIRGRSGSRLRRAALPVLYGAGALVALLGSSWVTSAPTELRLATIATSAAYFVTSYVARRRLRSRRMGLLFLATALAFLVTVFAGSDLPPFQGSDLPILLGLGFVGQGIGASLQVFLLLTFPEARLRRGPQAAAVTAIIGLLVVAYTTFIVLFNPEQAGLPEGAHPFYLPATAPIAGALAGFATVAFLAAFVSILVLLVGRWLRSSRPARRTLAPVVIAGSVSSALGITALLFGAGLSREGAVVLSTAQTAAYAAVPFGFLIGLLRLRMARGAVAELVVELGEAPAPERLREALATALHDPTLTIVYWSPAFRTYLDAEGAPHDPETDSPGRAVTYLEQGGQPLAAILHDPALSEDPGLVAAVAAAARLAVSNERLTSEVRAQLEEVRASRSRIVEASDAERRRVERNLHDGAQQRLVALSLALRRAQAELPAAVAPGSAATLKAASEQLAAALAELRELAKGIHPAVLSEAGLEPALRSLVRESPIKVALRVELAGDVPDAVGVAAYFVAAEALTNVAKYAAATRADLAVESDGRELRIEISDDGIGGADPAAGSGLRGLADRVAALGGRLDVRSPAGEGTRVVARLPLAAAPQLA